MTSPEIERSDDRLTVHLSGELDQDTVPELSELVLAGIDAADQEVVLELRSVTFCDSAGIAMLVRAHRHASERGTSLVLCNPSPILKATFAVCGLTDLLPVTSEP
jgi:anti-sigma B factor antagonist